VLGFLSPVIALKVKGVHRTKELVLLLHHARGSLREVETLLLLAEGLRYVSETETRRLLRLVEALAKTLNALIESLNPMAACVPQLNLV
jgi:four helix bundle protein